MISLRAQPELSPETLPTEFVINDLETTGLSPERCEIIQIAAVRFCAGCVAREETFLSDAPGPHRALENFARFVGDRAGLIAHDEHRVDD